MNKFTKVLALLVVGFSIVGFSSCAPSDSGNKDPISQKVPVSKISFELEKTELDLNEKTNIIDFLTSCCHSNGGTRLLAVLYRSAYRTEES